jgi:hypothetical protein
MGNTQGARNGLDHRGNTQLGEARGQHAAEQASARQEERTVTNVCAQQKVGGGEQEERWWLTRNEDGACK